MMRGLGFGVAGAGVAGMAVFGIAGAVAESKYTALEKECGGARCADQRYGSVVDTGRTLDTVATTGLVAGVAGMVIGGALILIGAPSKAPSAAAALKVSPRGPGFGLSGTF